MLNSFCSTVFTQTYTSRFYRQKKRGIDMVQICLWHNLVYFSNVHVSCLWTFLSSCTILSWTAQFSTCWTMCAINCVNLAALICKPDGDLGSQVGASATTGIFFLSSTVLYYFFLLENCSQHFIIKYFLNIVSSGKHDVLTKEAEKNQTCH